MNTSFKEALNALDKINTTLVESAHTDELFKLTREIAQLEKEIRELEDQKRKGWSDKYNARLEADWYKLCELEDELKELQDSYTYYTYDEDGHKDDSWEDEKKKAEVAEQEQELYKRLEEVRAVYYKLLDDLRQEHEAEFEPQTQELKTKYDTVKDNKTKKETVMKAILEEERPELEAICNKINKGTKLVTPIWKTFTADKRFWKRSETDDHRLYIELEGEPFEVEITEDDWDLDDNEAYFKEDQVLKSVAEDILLDSNEGFDGILDALDIDWDELNTAIKNKTPFAIPGHSWLFDTNIQVEIVGADPKVHSLWYDPGDYWNPPESEFIFDETITVKPTYTLVKIITLGEEEKLAEGKEEKSLTEAPDSLKESSSEVDSVRVMAWCTRHCVDFFEAVADNAPKAEQRKLNKEAYKAMEEKFGLAGTEAEDVMCKAYSLWKRLHWKNTEESLKEAVATDMYIVAADGEAGGSLYYIGSDYKAAQKEFKSTARDWRRYGLGGGDTPVCLYQYFGPVQIFDTIYSKYNAGEQIDYSVNIEELGFSLSDCKVLDEEWGD